MKRIGILADTHLRNKSDNLLSFYNNHLKDMDMIIHAGDFCSDAPIEILSKNKSFTGVCGNNDDLVNYNLNSKEILDIEGLTIGVFHGHGKTGDTETRSIETFKNDDVDIIIFGHSHQPLIKTKQGILLLNPGSPNLKRKEKWYSYIILTIKKSHISAELKFFENKLV